MSTSSAAAGCSRSVPGQRERVSVKRGELTEPNPTDRGKASLKYSLVTDATGRRWPRHSPRRTPHASLLFEPLLDALPAVRGKRGRPRPRPGKMYSNTGYNHRRCRASLRRRGIPTRIARRGVERGLLQVRLTVVGTGHAAMTAS